MPYFSENFIESVFSLQQVRISLSVKHGSFQDNTKDCYKIRKKNFTVISICDFFFYSSISRLYYKNVYSSCCTFVDFLSFLTSMRTNETYYAKANIVYNHVNMIVFSFT